MILTELEKGQKARILSVDGDTELSRRLMEMGFVSGKNIQLIKFSPLADPIEYDLDGFKISLRLKEAKLIKISLERLEKQNSNTNEIEMTQNNTDHFNNTNNSDFTIALIGNPNCGKTSIFNFATGSKERVANYSGVTVAAKEASLKIDGEKIKLVDLPGTYSLSGQSPDEKFVSDYLINNTPDLIINVLDASNLERNLYLNTQLKETGIKTIIALNMYDELKNDNAKIDIKAFENYIGLPIIPTIGKEGKAVQELFEAAKKYHDNPIFISKSAQLSYPTEIEYAISQFTDEFKDNATFNTFPLRFYAISALSGESFIWDIKEFAKHKSHIKNICANSLSGHCELSQAEVSRRIVEKRYSFIQKILAKVYISGTNKKQGISEKIDSILTHEKLGIPIFFGFVWLMFFLTFHIGEIPMHWIKSGVGSLGAIANANMSQGMLSSLVVNGIIGGVGGVLVFLPSIMILFFMISLMEDSGYMSRSAFLMDKLMQKAGLHGKSFIPLLMGFGCNVPAIMATRTLENKRDRILTMMAIPFMSCSARLPVYVLFISAFFPARQSIILFAIYGIGIFAAFITTLTLSKTVFAKQISPFIMELPPYRMPGGKSLLKHTWIKSLHFIKKMGTIILAASILVWALSYFPHNKDIIKKYDTKIELANSTLNTTSNNAEQTNAAVKELKIKKQAELLEDSYICRTGKAIQPVFEPMGFDWKMSVSILTGVMAKEVIVSTMGILYQSEQDDEIGNISLVDNLRADNEEKQTSQLTYFAFLVFILLYFPCLGTLAAMRREIKSLPWMTFAVVFPLLFSWIVSFLIVFIGGLF